MMKIVGVGAGPNLLTQEAIKVIENAEIIFGSKRAIELAKQHIRCKAHEIKDYTLQSLPENAVVLSTGDPMLSGLGKFAKEGDEIIPGISSLQLACSRLGLGLERVAVISAHAKDLAHVRSMLIKEIRDGKDVFLLPGSSFGIKDVANLLSLEKISRKLTVCEKLAYPDERISTGTVDHPPSAISDMYCVVIHH